MEFIGNVLKLADVAADGAADGAADATDRCEHVRHWHVRLLLIDQVPTGRFLINCSSRY